MEVAVEVQGVEGLVQGLPVVSSKFPHPRERVVGGSFVDGVEMVLGKGEGLM